MVVDRRKKETKEPARELRSTGQPEPAPSPFERLLGKIGEAEAEARTGGFLPAEQALRNMAAALRHHQKEAERVEAAAAAKS